MSRVTRTLKRAGRDSDPRLRLPIAMVLMEQSAANPPSSRGHKAPALPLSYLPKKAHTSKVVSLL